MPIPTLPSPILTSPASSSDQMGFVTFEWRHTGSLDPDEAFQVLIWKEGASEHPAAAQSWSEPKRTIDLDHVPQLVTGGPGQYLWSVVVVRRGTDERHSPEAPPRGFTYLGPVVPKTPTPMAMQEMRLLSYGYADTQPKTVLGVVSASGVSGISDVTFLPGGGDISHSGTMIAFDNCSFSARGIYTVHLDGSQRRMVAPIDGDYCSYVRWSPDDRKISYDSSVDNRLHVIQVDSGADKALPGTELSDFHSWSPQSDRIVYGKGIGGKRLLFITDMNGNITQLTYQKDFDDCETWAPDWSPDGSRIAFTSCDELYTISPDGTNLHLLVSGREVYAPRWSIDGQWILFISGTDLMRVRKSGESLTAVGKLPYRGGPFSIGPLD